jgi:hypothetical protein
MKKTLIILALLLASFWLIAMPALVGAYLEREAPAWLAEAGLGDRAELESAWFSSRLRIDETYELNLHIRHVPPTSLSWLRFNGSFQAPVARAPITVHVRFGLTGLGALNLETVQLAVDGTPRFDSGVSRLAIEQAPEQSGRLVWQTDAAELHDPLGNRLAARRLELLLAWAPTTRNPGRAGRGDDALESMDLIVDLQADGESAPMLGLKIEVSSIQREALADLIDGLQQLSQSTEGSTSRQFALLTVAGAWQQLTENGLGLRLASLEIGPEARFSGRWSSDENQPVIDGAGSIDALGEALVPVVGLSAGLSPPAAARLIERWINEVEQRGWLTIEAGRFELQYPEG